MARRAIARVAAFFLCLALAVLFPWWITFTVLACFSFAFGGFYEGVIAVLFLDVMYNTSGVGLLPNVRFTLAALILVFIVKAVRKRVLIYHESRNPFSASI